MTYATFPKTALITGSAKRIGRAIALFLAREGYDIALHYHHSQPEALATQSEIEALGKKVTCIAADLTVPEEVARLYARAKEALGPITCLVNNAAHFENDTIANVTENSWNTHLTTNLQAPLLLMQAVASDCPEGIQGNIINMLDYCVLRPSERFLSYTVSKSALWTLTQILARTLAPHFRVNAIGPGPTFPSPKQTEAQFKQSTQMTPLGYGTQPDDICESIRYILNTPSLTGQLLSLASGRHLSDDPYL